MSTRLPERIDPLRLANRGTRLAGELPLSAMERLIAVVHQATETARVELEFDLDADGRARIAGRVSTVVQLLCQRCLKPVAWPVERSVGLTAVESPSQADNLAQDMDPLICGEAALKLLDIIEDELLLALPQEAKHREGQCAVRHQWSYGDDDSGELERPRDNPFAVLAQLKDRD